MQQHPNPRPAEPLAGLNDAQREAVMHHEGPALVLAGAGSGKTRVLTARIARLVQHHGVDPRRVLAVTFTNKAAGEMRERIGRLLGADPTGMWVGTFHAIGARMLRSSAKLVGRTPSFTIYDEDDTLATLKRVMERLRLDPKEFAPKAVLQAISEAKNQLVGPVEYARLALDKFSTAVAKVYTEFEPELRRANAVTFDDLLLLPVEVLERDEATRTAFQERFNFVLVDEYQDTNRAQYRLVVLLAGERGNVLVVGDDDQSIYGWRGADIRNILDFERDFPAAKVVRLEENYRSTPQILQMANWAISANKDRRGKTLRATRPAGERPTVVGCFDERDEADTIAEEIMARRAGRDNMMLRDAAVLYRTNSQSRAVEEAMRKHGLPYRLVGAVRFYDRREIRDLMSYLKLIANPNDDEAFRRAIAVPKRGLGDVALEQLDAAARAANVRLLSAAANAELVNGLRPAARTAFVEFARVLGTLRERAREAGVDEILRELLDAIRYVDYLKAEGPEGLERIDNVRELVESAAETVADEEGEVGLTPLDHFLQKATLVSQLDQLGPDADAVTMMTLHNAKGLEFPLVFLSGMEDGLFPLARAFDDPAMLEEERRLFYVGITRAERKLFLLHAEQRRRNGEMMHGRRSSFLQDIPEGLVDYRKSVKSRSMGRGSYSDALAGNRSAAGFGARGVAGRGGDGSTWSPRETPSQRRPGTPVARASAMPEPEDVSQDAPTIVVGARVQHRKFGAGTIAELTGAGRDAKARIDFDDEAIGRKTLVLAQANLEPVLE